MWRERYNTYRRDDVCYLTSSSFASLLDLVSLRMMLYLLMSLDL